MSERRQSDGGVYHAISLTQEGIGKIADSVSRLEVNKKACREMGAKVKRSI